MLVSIIVMFRAKIGNIHLCLSVKILNLQCLKNELK